MKLSPNHDSFRRVDESSKARNAHNNIQDIRSLLEGAKELTKEEVEKLDNIRNNRQAFLFEKWSRDNPNDKECFDRLKVLHNEGLLTNSETVRRTTCALQSRFPHLRGSDWDKNQAHDRSPTLFAISAKPVLVKLANHKDLKVVCRNGHTEHEWRDVGGKVWANEKNGAVFLPKREFGKLGLESNCVDVYLGTAYAERRTRVTREREENPTVCYEIPMDDILNYLKEGA